MDLQTWLADVRARTPKQVGAYFGGYILEISVFIANPMASKPCPDAAGHGIQLGCIKCGGVGRVPATRFKRREHDNGWVTGTALYELGQLAQQIAAYLEDLNAPRNLSGILRAARHEIVTAVDEAERAHALGLIDGVIRQLEEREGK